jgi:hypothetical protein
MEEVEQVDEAGTGLLMNFIKAKGLNPLSMDGNQKQAYSRSSEFRIFKQKHQKEEFDRLIETYGAENLLQIVLQKQELQETSGMGERGDDWNEQSVVPAKKAKEKKLKEELDKADTVTMDIPLLIRVLEFAREDAKTDMDLHKVVENLIKMRDGGTLSMAEYDKIVAIKEAIEAKYGKEYQDMVKRVGQKAAQKPVDMKSLAARMQAGYKQIKELKKMPDNMDADDHITREDLRQWFSKTHPEGGWKRINSKGDAIGPCAREPGEPKPKCMSNEKRAQLTKKERAAAVAAKRKNDPVADRPGKGGKPVNVSNYGKGKLSEEDLTILENHIAIAMGKMLDDEGGMTLGQIEQMQRSIEMIRSYLGDEYEKQLPAWVQAKITLATDYVDTVGNYLSNKNEKVNEASSPAQQAAIAIAMKKAGKKPKNEEVEHIDEGMMTHIDVKPAKKGGDSETIAKHDVHYKGEKIGHIEVYKHRSGMKYGDEHHATGEGTAGHRSMDDAIDSLRQTHADYLKDKKDSAKATTKSLIKLAKMKEEVEQIEEKNSPTNSKLWSRAKALARSKFDVYPSAYANGWASKWYKSKGGGWRSVKEDIVQEGLGNVEDSPMSATNSVKAMESAHRKNQMKSARMIKSLYKNKVKESLYDWEKDDKPNAKIVVKGGTTMTGQPRDTIEIEPVLKTRPSQPKPTV